MGMEGPTWYNSRWPAHTEPFMASVAWARWSSSSSQVRAMSSPDSGGSSYSIEGSMDDDMGVDAEGHSFLEDPAAHEGEKRRRFARRESDTLANRAVFLVVVGLLVVFFVCVAR